MRNQAVNVLRREKKLFYEDKIDKSKGDSKKMWQTIKQLFGQKKEDLPIDKINFEGYSGPPEENFNKYYSDSIRDLAESIEDKGLLQFGNDLEVQKEQLAKFQEITFSQLQKIVSSLKNKSSSDGFLSPKLLKDLFCVVGYPLLNIVNTVITSGRIPSDLKISVIVPIAKVPSPTLPEQFRPINLLPTIDKIIEIVLRDQLKLFFERNNILYSGQSGFRDGHSCETALQFACFNWREEINKGKVVLSVFVDLKRAFETIDRKLLLYKLQKYGIKSDAIKLIHNYLQGRYHQTRVGNSVSNGTECNFGVPQGSVLGPLLFIIYINDIKDALQQSFVSLFADDTLISVAATNFEEAVRTLNSELSILYDWLCINKLKLNANKTKFMAMGSKSTCNNFAERNFIICINNIAIEQVYTIKYLGVILDPQLTFNSHADYLCRKLGKKIGFFRRIASNLSQWSRNLVYNTIVYPHFNFCMSLLLSCNKEQVSRLQVLQNKCMRVVLKCNIYTPIKNMLQTLNWLSIEQNIKKATLVVIYKMMHQLTPKYLSELLVTRQHLHSRHLRSDENFNINFSNKTFLMGSLLINGIHLFNNLPKEIKDSSNLNLFNKKLCKYLRESN